MCTITSIRITATGTMAIGLAGAGTRVAGSNGAESNVLSSRDLMKHRPFLQALAVVSTALLCSTHLGAQVLKPGNTVSLRCLGNVPGPRYLDGRTANGTIGLAPNSSPKFSGTVWRVVRAGGGAVALKCLGDVGGPRWLDGRTADGTVGLANTTEPPFTGTKWEVVPID
jgi:hypothetical protein